MNPVAPHRGRRVLEPAERIAEILFGLIMVLTFIGSLSVADAGRDDVRVMLIGALGCNLAWAVIDAAFYLMGSLAEKGGRVATLRAVREAAGPAEAHRAIADRLPAPVSGVLGAEDFEMLRARLNEVPLPAKARLDASDWRGAVGVFLLVFLSTFPVAVPFMVFHDLWQAMRVSNGTAIMMLFLAGIAYGRCIGRSAWLIGLVMVLLGATLVAMTIALGG
jgi:uncharacterized membrane protein YjgN (DUF898 family)